MKAEHAERALRLVEALSALGDIRKALADKRKNFAGVDYRAFEISVVCDVGEAGNSTEDYVHLPLEFGDLVLPIIEERLRAELTEIGVEP